MPAISHRINYLTMFRKLGYNTLLFDYRGYGQSSGKPSESGTYLDAQAAWRYLTETKGISSEHIVLFGESLGGAVAAWLAAREKPGLLALASAFTSVPGLAAEIYPFLPVRWISQFEYNTLRSLQSVRCPVFSHTVRKMILCRFTMAGNYFKQPMNPSSFSNWKAVTIPALFLCNLHGKRL